MAEVMLVSTLFSPQAGTNQKEWPIMASLSRHVPKLSTQYRLRVGLVLDPIKSKLKLGFIITQVERVHSTYHDRFF